MLVRYNPFRSLWSRPSLLPSLFDDDFVGFFPRVFGDFLRLDEPKLEWVEKEKNYLIRAEFPGYEKDEVKAEVVDGVLRLRAEHKEEKWDQNEEEGWRSIETRTGHYSRSIPLPEDVVVDKIKAEMKNGVLRMTLPRDPKKAPAVKEIPVQ